MGWACHHSLSKTMPHGTRANGRRRGRQRKHWTSLPMPELFTMVSSRKHWTSLPMPELFTMVSSRKDWTSLPMPELFTMVSSRKDWKSFSVESYIRYTPSPHNNDLNGQENGLSRTVHKPQMLKGKVDSNAGLFFCAGQPNDSL